MSQHNAQIDKDIHVISYLEIVMVFSIFIVILFLLFPKNRLQEQVLSEKKNYDLTAIYLQNLIKLDSKNEDLIYSSAKALSKQQKYDLSLELLNILEKDKSSDLNTKAILLHQSINKLLIAKESDPLIKATLLKKDKTLTQNLLQSDGTSLDLNNSKTLYQYALLAKDKHTMLKFNRIILEKVHTNKDRIYWLENYHYIASQLKQKQKDKVALKALVLFDQKRKDYWFKALLPLLDKNVNMSKLAKELNIDNKTLQKLYKGKQKNLITVAMYIKQYKKSKNIKEKNKLFIKIVDILIGTNLKKAVKFARRYENRHMSSIKIQKKLLSLYLAANRADLARLLSIKILKRDAR